MCIFAIEKAYYMSYYKRTADALLQDLLDAFGAVLDQNGVAKLQLRLNLQTAF